MKSVEQVIESVIAADRLDHICMSPGERRAAQASLRRGEMIAEMLMRANEDLRRLFSLIGRGVGALLHRGKPSTATRAWRLP
jgi:hypothetical protein